MANFTVIWEQEQVGEYSGYSGRGDPAITAHTPYPPLSLS